MSTPIPTLAYPLRRGDRAGVAQGGRRSVSDPSQPFGPRRSSPATSSAWAIEVACGMPRDSSAAVRLRETDIEPLPKAAPSYEPRTDRSASVRVLILTPGAGLVGLGFRRSLKQEAEVRCDEGVGRRH